MSGHRITRYVEITGHRETPARVPEPVHPGWQTRASQRSTRAVAVGRRTVWAATWGGVLALGRGRDVEFYDRYASEHGLPGNPAACLCLDASDRPVVATDEGSVAWFDGSRWHAAPGWNGGPVKALATGPAGGVWAATEEGIYHASAPDQPPGAIAREQDGAVQVCALLADGDGVLAGSSSGLFRVRRGQSPERLEVGRLAACTALTRDVRGDVWAASPRTIYHLGGGDSTFPADGVAAPDRILGLAACPGGAFVLTTAGPGQVTGGRWQGLGLPVGPGGEALPVRAIAARADESFLWAGTDERLAVGWPEPEGFAWDAGLLPPHADDSINNAGRCAVPRGEDVLVGTAGGLLRFDASGRWELLAGGDVRALCEAADAAYFLARPGGVGRLNSKDAAFLARQPPGVPLALGAGLDGVAHLLTTRGLFAPGKHEPLLVAPGVDLAVNCLAQTPGGPWWLGTDRGVFRAGHSGWELAGEQPGPLQSAVYALTVEGGDLFAATESGLWRRRTVGWQQCVSGPVRAVARAAAGGLWFAGAQGVARRREGYVTAPLIPSNSGLPARSVVALLDHGGCLWIVTGGGVGRLRIGENPDE
jgi:ligand-binding sensor domain-containing protein